MKRPLKWIALGVVVLLLGGGVLRALSAREAAKQALAAQQTAQKQEASVELTARDVVQAQTLDLQQVLPISGALKALNSAFVKVKVAGEIQGFRVREGDFVRAGQVLGRIDTTESQARVRQAQQQAEAARAQVDIAQRSLDNNQSLVNQGFISRTALDTSLNNLNAAQATFKAAQAGADLAQKSLDDTVLRAPIGGQIAQRLVQDGERVSVDTKVLEVVDLGALELEAALSAADSVKVRVGQVAQLRIEGLEQPIPAKVARINPGTVAGSRSVLAYLRLDSAVGLRQGLFAQGSLATGQVKALAVPLDAVRTDKPQPYVQRVVDGKVVQVQGMPEGAELLMGAVGALREGTLIKRTAGKS